jgi:hypothetical protein
MEAVEELEEGCAKFTTSRPAEVEDSVADARPSMTLRVVGAIADALAFPLSWSESWLATDTLFPWTSKAWTLKERVVPTEELCGRVLTWYVSSGPGLHVTANVEDESTDDGAV